MGYLTSKQPSGERSEAYLGRHYYSGADLPDEIDWTTKGAVSAVKDQGQCGSCWAFSAVGSMEGRHQLARGGDVVQFSEQQLVDALRFQLYGKGILKGLCGASLDHGVLAVGYGVEDGTKYWKVKNSWGKSWGENGYIRLLKGKDGKGECGIRSGPPSYPVIASEVNV